MSQHHPTEQPPTWSPSPVQATSGVIEPLDSPRVAAIPLSLVGGLIGAAIGAGIWAAVAYFLDMEVGYVAIIMGFLSGFGAVLLSGGKRGAGIGLIAVVTALAGIATGKYLAVYFIVLREASNIYGVEMSEAMSLVPILDGETMTEMIAIIRDTFEILDLLFIGLAILAAWSIANGKRRGR